MCRRNKCIQQRHQRQQGYQLQSFVTSTKPSTLREGSTAVKQASALVEDEAEVCSEMSARKRNQQPPTITSLRADDLEIFDRAANL